MALTYGFYNSINGDRVYDAIQMGQIFDGIITDGIYATYLKAMVVKASDNPSEVIVQPGRAWFNHTWTYIDADYPIETPSPEVILDRVDTLVLDINSEYSMRENTIVWVQGTPASINPEPPALINTTTHHQYPLCNVYRKAGTTMIYAADITNRVGTSDTPFVTGVLEGINIDDLLAQWDDEFRTWEATTKTSFEAWMVNQQSVYITWFDSIKDQMEGDLTDFEAWFETIRGIIDQEAATHLQAEIDELKDMLPAGSHIDISTSEPSLLLRNVTVSDGVHSKTVQFDSTGAATVESFPYIGIIDISSTDGERIADASISVPYFGRYSATLAFWAATVNLIGDETLAGTTVTVKDGNGDVVAVVTLGEAGTGVFTATKPDTYKFIYTYGGQTMEVSLSVTQETTYEVEIHGGFNYQTWLTAGRVSESFSSLDDILEDEPTLRQLFLVHDSVDYICNTFTSGSLADVTKIFNCDLAAKWINLSDYALDSFYAVSDIKDIMDAADKYGYGEWALMPQVPKMSSNTAPYGEAFGSSAAISGSPYYYAFDGSDSTSAQNSTSTLSGAYLGYHFVTPIKVKYVVAKGLNGVTQTCVVQGSNDNATWDTLSDDTSIVKDTFAYINLDNENAYSYYRMYQKATTTSSGFGLYTLQFYAWAPKGNVPIMTSNTAPYGTAKSSTAYSSSGAWQAFANDVYSNENKWFISNSVANHAGDFIGYVSPNPICVKKFGGHLGLKVSGATSQSTIVIKLQGSNDGGTTWDDLSDNITTKWDDTDLHDSNSTAYYLYHRVYVVSGGISGTRFCAQLQFYGRELSVSVPVMTSDTAPYGEALPRTGMDTTYHNEAYKAFDGNDSTKSALATANVTAYNGYKFNNLVNVKKAYVYSDISDKTLTWQVQYSDDNNTWVNASAAVETKRAFIDVTDSGAHLYWRIVRTVINGGGAISTIMNTLQFYGLDYSEKEFEVGTTKKWLYDHGVKLENLEIIKGSSTTSPVSLNERNQIYIDKVVGTNANLNNFVCVGTTVDLSSYSLSRVTMGDKNTVGTSGTNSSHIDVWSTKPTNGGSYVDANRQSYKSIDIPIPAPNEIGLDISSINASRYISIDCLYYTNKTCSVKEWWLE